MANSVRFIRSQGRSSRNNLSVLPTKRGQSHLLSNIIAIFTETIPPRPTSEARRSSDSGRAAKLINMQLVIRLRVQIVVPLTAGRQIGNPFAGLATYMILLAIVIVCAFATFLVFAVLIVARTKF